MNTIIENSNKKRRNTVVLIDNDDLMRMAWAFAAEAAQQNITTYASFDAFMNDINHYDDNTLVYIDSDLGNNIKGEDCARLLFDKGFMNLHLATGYSRDQFGQMPWIKSIVGKEPPF